MDFSTIPDNVFSQILGYLPFEECVRAGRVNSAFLRISEMAISKSKLLDFSDSTDRPRRFTPLAVAKLVGLCSERKLQEIRFGSAADCRVDDDDYELSLLQAFLGFRCPRLQKFTCCCTIIGDLLVRRLFENNPYLKSIAVIDGDIRFPIDTRPSIATDRLESLEYSCTEDVIFESLIGRVPNLKHFKTTIPPTTNARFVIMFDRFLDTVPNLETLRIRNGRKIPEEEKECSDDGAEFLIDKMNSFWRLKKLLELEINDYSIIANTIFGKRTVTRIANSFPALRTLKLSVRDRGIIDRGLADLSALRELEELRLICPFGAGCGVDMSQPFRAAMPRLRKVRMESWYGVVYPRMFSALLSPTQCPVLCSIELFEVRDIDNGAEASELLLGCFRGHRQQQQQGSGELLSSEEKRRITVTSNLGRPAWPGFPPFDATPDRPARWARVWQSDQVKMALNTLAEEHGVEIKFFWKESQE